MLSFGKNTYSFYYSYRILEDKIRIFLKNQNFYLKAIKFNPLVLVTKYIYTSQIYMKYMQHQMTEHQLYCLVLSFIYVYIDVHYI